MTLLHIIGDSQACRTANYYTSSHSFVTATTNAGIVVDCKVGSRVSDWNAHIDSIAVQPGEHALIFLGSNQISSTPDPTYIVQSLLKRGAQPVWVGPPLIHGVSGPFS